MRTVSEDYDSDELTRDRTRQARSDGTRSSTELLDLVRSAEEAATVAARSPREDVGAVVATEEIVEVGEEALDAPPSLPPEQGVLAGTRGDRTSGVHSRARPPQELEARRPVAPAPRPLPPVVGVVVLLALAIGALAMLAR
jgi:hypothetical protein